MTIALDYEAVEWEVFDVELKEPSKPWYIRLACRKIQTFEGICYR